jgi:hypothetical protein
MTNISDIAGKYGNYLFQIKPVGQTAGMTCRFLAIFVGNYFLKASPLHI